MPVRVVSGITFTTRNITNTSITTTSTITITSITTITITSTTTTITSTTTIITTTSTIIIAITTTIIITSLQGLVLSRVAILVFKCVKQFLYLAVFGRTSLKQSIQNGHVFNNSYTYQFWVEPIQNSQSRTVNGYLIGVCAFQTLVSIRCSIQRLLLVGCSTVLCILF